MYIGLYRLCRFIFTAQLVTCRICCQKLDVESEFKEHMKAEHPQTQLPKLWLCKQCPFVAVGITEYRSHMELHSASALKCPFCSYLTRLPKKRRQHLEQGRCIVSLQDDILKETLDILSLITVRVHRTKGN